MELQIENIIAAYKAADDNGKNLLRTMFPNIEFEGDKQAEKRPITERIKTFEDAKIALGEEHPLVKEWLRGENLSSNLEAYLQLRVICAALNEGWEPQFTEDEWRYYPWFYLYTQAELDGMGMGDGEKQELRMIDTAEYVTEYAGFGSAYSSYTPSNAAAYIGSCLFLRSRELAEYCGKQFIKLWADFNLIRK